MKRLLGLFFILVFVLVFAPTIIVQAINRGCNITSFTLSPSGPTFNLGDLIALDGKSTCGTVRFEINQEPKSEIGSTNLTMNFNTNELGGGNHAVCFVARGEGGWENADRRCITITVKGNKPKCEITSFSYSPQKSVYSVGDEIYFDGKSTCGTVKYTIENKVVNELGSTSLTYLLYTNEWGQGNIHVCFYARGDGSWETADKRCITIFIDTDPGLPLVNPTEQPPAGGDDCQVKSLTVEPRSANQGDTIYMKGTGECSGGTRAVKFTVDGEPKGELGAPTLEATWNTNGYSKGTHKVCFLVVETDWSKAASKCVNVSLGGTSEPVNTNCKNDHAAFIADISVPDGTSFLPGEIFIKTWRIMNDGDCVWNKNYNFTSVQGDRMKGKNQNIPGTVHPGQTIDISVEMHAPVVAGNYKTSWGITDPGGNIVNKNVYVSIEVGNRSTSQQPDNDPQTLVSEMKSMDILGYCKSKGYSDAFANNKNNANSWICASSTDQSRVNFDEVCKFTIGDEYSKAKVQDDMNPNSWYCVVGNEEKTNPPILIEETPQNVDTQKPNEELFRFGSKPVGNYAFDLSKMNCSGITSNIDETLAALINTKIWPILMEQAESRQVSFNFCGLVIPTPNFKQIIPVYNDLLMNPRHKGEADFESNALKINPIYYLFDSLDSRANTLGHEMQHIIDNEYRVQKYKGLLDKDQCDLLTKQFEEAYMFEIRGYAISKALQNNQSIESLSVDDRNKIEEEKSIYENYIVGFMNTYNKRLNACQKYGYLENKHLETHYDNTLGILIVELK